METYHFKLGIFFGLCIGIMVVSISLHIAKALTTTAHVEESEMRKCIEECGYKF